MVEFDKPQFEFYMKQGVKLHNQRQYDQALRVSIVSIPKQANKLALKLADKAL